ncbi:CBS domain-containing protein CBSX1, chloroplastic [Elaeis guineensis]|uniref:CBS domain-containing protein CBSX1, chloroplastic isoform X2 n=1 Tax=Elaeis guineensis var. tenera TaxID=51953 RepID=A0A6I9RKK7_ELAGV|nr:CBS domain-containing protein CBSX1, chloroplastic isoform X2 [Elaeis guineensis]
MDSLLLTNALLPSCFLGSVTSLPLLSGRIVPAPRPAASRRTLRLGFAASSRASAMARNGPLMTNSMSQSDGVYTVGDFMTKKEDLYVVKPTTSVDEALEMLVEHRITGFPVIDDDWTLVGVVSDYDLLALDSISGSGRNDTSMFPEVDSTWKTFNEIQKLLSKINGKVIGDVMTPAPLVVRETTNLEDAARLLLETKYRRLPVVDNAGKLVGIITRGNVVRAALQIKHDSEKNSRL